jgi:hypothetical protein
VLLLVPNQKNTEKGDENSQKYVLFCRRKFSSFNIKHFSALQIAKCIELVEADQPEISSHKSFDLYIPWLALQSVSCL